MVRGDKAGLVSCMTGGPLLSFCVNSNREGRDLLETTTSDSSIQKGDNILRPSSVPRTKGGKSVRILTPGVWRQDQSVTTDKDHSTSYKAPSK